MKVVAVGVNKVKLTENYKFLLFYKLGTFCWRGMFKGNRQDNCGGKHYLSLVRVPRRTSDTTDNLLRIF